MNTSDTAKSAFATVHTNKRPGHIHPLIIGSGKFSGVCVLHALKRPEVQTDDHTKTKERLEN